MFIPFAVHLRFYVKIIFCSAMPPQHQSVNLIISAAEGSTHTAAAFSPTGSSRTVIVVITVNDPACQVLVIVLVINLSVLEVSQYKYQ